jgi:predicted small lipoprotein YifL
VRIVSAAVMGAAIVIFTASCGQKGPLYLPDKKPATVVTSPEKKDKNQDPDSPPKKLKP